jgi:hypothetical protein
MAAYTQGKTQDRDAWINVQKKTFSRWANNHLKKRNMQIEDLYEDVKSGVLLLNLLEVIGGESVKAVLNVKYNKKPKMRIQMLENGNRVLDYVKAKGLQDLVNIGANDFVDGNPKIILGFLWKVILRFVVSEDGQKGLLLWCQLATKPYDNVNIKNFHRSWNDGLGFVGVIHKYRPDLIADPATLNPENAAENCELAFSVAEEKLGMFRAFLPYFIPYVLSCIIGKPFSLSLSLSLSLFTSHFNLFIIIYKMTETPHSIFLTRYFKIARC